MELTDKIFYIHRAARPAFNRHPKPQRLITPGDFIQKQISHPVKLIKLFLS